MTRIFHMGASKRYFYMMIQAETPGWRGLFVPPWRGTVKEALKALQDDPREILCSCDCEKEPNGACAGYERGAG